ncbi:PREDICTED: dehydrogenase/reductase SDR family member 2, mitochondrial isoform X3 [Condylura cristata]|uniref:dehydrogenase/reductase SDR family member 2, mitochondrial isoform X3 n=1 Tax=Condylura cristata TaxID=143302 RepID=UPI000643574C|nr:PREDICTED: dehydrogenase/reductase SDR family member 2, mitochondrial isoform X3 [Condylura cristata]
MSSSGIQQKGVLANRVAVVTGATDGIGFAIARRLAQDGAHVVVSSRKQQNVDRAVAVLQGEGLSVTGTVCHVGKAEDRERLVATILDVNVKAPALLLSQLLPHMENRGNGSVILVSSIAAYMPHVPLGVYNVSKTALLGLTRTLALELAPKDIRVNCLVPGVIKTNFSKVVRTGRTRAEILTPTVRVPCRIGQPEDCAGIVSFLCSPDASYITGENIVVAGFSPRL